MSQCRQLFHNLVEDGINKQINMELFASYTYQCMAFHFARDDVALPGFHKFFKKQSEEEREHAQKLMKYQNTRGGRVQLQDIKKPTNSSWASGLEAMKESLALERNVNQALLDLHGLGAEHKDAQFCDFLESEYLEEQIESIKQISDFITNLVRVGPGLGEYMFDKETLDS